MYQQCASCFKRNLIYGASDRQGSREGSRVTGGTRLKAENREGARQDFKYLEDTMMWESKKTYSVCFQGQTGPADLNLRRQLLLDIWTNFLNKTPNCRITWSRKLLNFNLSLEVPRQRPETTALWVASNNPLG